MGGCWSCYSHFSPDYHLNRATLRELSPQQCYDNNCLHILGHSGLCSLVIHPEINISCLHTFSVYGSCGLCADSSGIISKIFLFHDFISFPWNLLRAMFSQPIAPLQISLHVFSSENPVPCAGSP